MTVMVHRNSSAVDGWLPCVSPAARCFCSLRPETEIIEGERTELSGSSTKAVSAFCPEGGPIRSVRKTHKRHTNLCNVDAVPAPWQTINRAGGVLVIKRSSRENISDEPTLTPLS